jgi:hypothetical protein
MFCEGKIMVHLGYNVGTMRVLLRYYECTKRVLLGKN